MVNTICVIYLDDILIYSVDKKAHEKHVKQVLNRLREYKLYCNLKKCEFLIDYVEFLRFRVATEGVSIDRSCIKHVLN